MAIVQKLYLVDKTIFIRRTRYRRKKELSGEKKTMIIHFFEYTYFKIHMFSSVTEYTLSINYIDGCTKVKFYGWDV